MSDLLKHYRQLVGIAKTWATKSLPMWDDDLHRQLLARHGAREKDGRVSASTMTVPQLSAVLDDYERRGWPRRKGSFAGGGVPRAVPPRIARIVTLWGKLGQAGKLEANATRRTLLTFCSNRVKRELPDLDSLTVRECQNITEALKSWLAR